MSSLPVNHVKAPARIRFCAAIVNSTAIGIITSVVDAIWADEDHANRPPILVGLLIIFWLVSALKCSPGAAICMLSHWTEDSQPLKSSIRLVHSLPYLFLAIVAFTPSAFVPEPLSIGRPLCIFAGAIGITIDGLLLGLTGRSLLDRWFKVAVLKLSLPTRIMPTFFGRRLM
jgi:hypothetical protein